MEDKKFQEIEVSTVDQQAGGGFLASDDELDNLLGGGGSPATEEQPEPIPQEKSKITKDKQVPPITDDTKSEDITAEDNEDEASAIDRILAENEEPENTDEKEKLEKEDTKETSDPEDTDDSIFTSLSQSLIDLGIFTAQEEDAELPATPEEFKERWESEQAAKSQANIYNFISSEHGEEGVAAFNAIFVNGVSPKEYLSRYNEIVSTKDIDLTIESNQEKVFKDYYKKIGWTDEKINKHLEKQKTLGELEDTVSDLHELLLEKETAELEQLSAQAEQRNQQKIQAEQFYQSSLAEILQDKLKKKEFDGIPVTDKVARETYSYLTDKKFRLPSGDLLTTFDKDILELRKPENYELKLKMALLLRNGFDLSSIKTKAVSETKDKVFDKVVRQNRTQAKKNPVNPNENTSSFFSNLVIKK